MKKAIVLAALASLVLIGGCGKSNSTTLDRETKSKPYELVDTRIHVAESDKEYKLASFGAVAAGAAVAAVIDYGIDKLKEKGDEQRVTRTVKSHAYTQGKYVVTVANGLFSSEKINVPGTDAKGVYTFEGLKKKNVVCAFSIDIGEGNQTIEVDPIKVEYADSMTGGWGGERNLSFKISVNAQPNPKEAMPDKDKAAQPAAVFIIPFEDIDEGTVVDDGWFGNKTYMVALPGKLPKKGRYTITVEMTEIKGKSAFLMKAAGVIEEVSKAVIEEQFGQ